MVKSYKLGFKSPDIPWHFDFFGQATTSAARPAPAAGACNPVGFPPSAPGYREMYLVAGWEMTWKSWNDWRFYGDNYGDSMVIIMVILWWFYGDNYGDSMVILWW